MPTASAAQPVPNAAEALFDAQQLQLAGCFNEMFGPDGQVRAHWTKLVGALEKLGPAELSDRWAGARRLIRENGVTYNAHSDPRGLDRPWTFDPLPVLLEPTEWAKLEVGLRQRARVLEAVLEDVYGHQSLLSEGLLPAELVFAHPGFLRACHLLEPVGGRRLHLYGVDLGRGPDGQFRVLSDRTQAPSGAGYALENRIVVSRMLPELYRDSRVLRLAPFFRTLRETLRSLAPRHRDDPRIVLLTPGPYSETYFEHAYLARYLGLTLVEGGDLTVRDEQVFLKQLGGLQPVDVILRRLDDAWCDPLELRGESLLGVAGLVQAARAGQVAIANSLGSGIAESPALAAFLPALCRRLLGEELRLPSVHTLWCGVPESRKFVLDHLDELVIKPAFPASGVEPIFGDKLTASGRAELAGRIRDRPRDFVAQERLELSAAPAVADRAPSERASRLPLAPRHMALRVFLTAAGPAPETDFAVMPGGLCRVSPTSESPVVSIQRGGGSKDAWVLSTEPVKFVSLLAPADRPVELTRGGDDLPSRVADNLFWLGRYLERAEGLSRLLRGALSRPMDPVGPGELPMLLSGLVGRPMQPLREPTHPSVAQNAAQPVAAQSAAQSTPDSAGDSSRLDTINPHTTGAHVPATDPPAGPNPPHNPAPPRVIATEAPPPPPGNHRPPQPPAISQPPTAGGGPQLPEEIVGPLIFDTTLPLSLAGTLTALQRVTRTVRDRLSADAWRILNGLSVGEPPAPDPETGQVEPLDHAALMEMLNRLVTGLSAFCGLMMESTTRGAGWRFLDMGRRLERCLSVTRLLRSTLASGPIVAVAGAAPPGEPPLEAVLEIADSIMTYRRRYRAAPQPAAVLDLLLADEANPRSLAFQLAALAEHVDRLSSSTDRSRAGRSEEQKLVLGLLTLVRLADPHALAATDSLGQRPGLLELLDRCDADLPMLSELLTRHYFSHAAARRRSETHAFEMPAPESSMG